MAFVAVVKLILYAKFFEHQHTADAKQILLFDTILPISAIKLVGDAAVKLTIHVKVCVKQVELHTAYVDAPYMTINVTAGVGNLKNHRMAILVKHRLDGQLIEVRGFVVGYLLSVDTETLCEIAVSV